MSSQPCLDEATFMDLLMGTLPPERAARVDEHLDACVSCRRMVSEAFKAQPADEAAGRVPEPLVDTHATTLMARTHTGSRPPGGEEPLLERGTAVGRYLVVERLGAGGMGVVYSAYDPELDRRVALKLLREKALGLDAERARAHLLHEAQAMARVSHPNVVPVYDVGTLGGQVFLAMEWVEAQTLREWLKAGPRPWRQVRDVLTDAGRGLAAAHAAGIIHGDFKPENVLVGRDGRVRVTDFGLSRSVGGPREDSGQPLGGGTPAYMAPEQFTRVGHANAASDQFSFCATFYEGLYGERPFAGDTVAALSAEVRAGRVRPASKGTAVPPWLRRVVVRGLSVEPVDRHPSLEALLAALQADPAARLQRRLRAAAGLGLVLGAVGVTHAVHSRAARACEGAERELTGVWDAERQRAAEAAFRGTGRPFAAAAWTRVQRALDAYSAAWVTTRTAACEATRVRGEQPEPVMAQRMRCLDQRLAEVSALTRLFTQADAELVERAPRAVAALTPLADCSDVASLAAHGPAPTQPEARERAEAWRQVLAQGQALKAAGRYAPAVTLLAPAVKEAKEAGDRASAADLGVLLAEMHELAGDKRTARDVLFAALWSAEAGRNDDAAARGWTLAVRVAAADTQEGQEQAALWRERADAAIERLGGSAQLRADLDLNVSQGLYVQGRYSEAAERSESALQRLERLHGADGLAAADARLELGSIRLAQGRPDEALALFEQALAPRRQALGPDHPDVGAAQQEVAAALLRLRRPQEAEGHIRQALDVFERSLGPEHPQVSSALNLLATCLQAQQRHEDAIPAFERSLRITEKTQGRASTDYALLANNLARVLVRVKRIGEARVLFRGALEQLEANFGPDYATLPIVLRGVAYTLHLEGQHREALPYLQRAARIQVAQPDDVFGGWTGTLLELGRELLDVGQPREALAPLEKALAGWERARPSPTESANLRFLLARALWETGTDRPRALKLAGEAREQAPSLPPAAAQELRPVVEAWLAARAGEARR